MILVDVVIGLVLVAAVVAAVGKVVRDKKKGKVGSCGCGCGCGCNCSSCNGCGASLRNRTTN